jgi:hypothetical protein
MLQPESKVECDYTTHSTALTDSKDTSDTFTGIAL